MIPSELLRYVSIPLPHWIVSIQVYSDTRITLELRNLNSGELMRILDILNEREKTP